MAKKKTQPAKKKTASAARKKTAKKPAKKTAKMPVKKTANKKPVKAQASKKTTKDTALKKKAVAKAKGRTNARNKTAKAAEGVSEALQKTLGKGKKGKKFKLPAADRRLLKKALQELRDRVVDEITFLAGDNLNRSQREASGDLSSYSIHMADQGTDNFDREFALNLVSSEQDVLYEIDEALQRLEEGSYGVCEACECTIEKARLEALPFTRMCIKCKSAAERGRTRYRPFGPTISKA